MPLIDNDIFMVTKKDQFIIDDESPALPVDKNKIPVKIGDLLLLKHNGKRLRVRLMHYCGDGIWHIFGYGGGGGFSLPESAHNITHILDKELI